MHVIRNLKKESQGLAERLAESFGKPRQAESVAGILEEPAPKPATKKGSTERRLVDEVAKTKKA
jgi:hypothetical protein